MYLTFLVPKGGANPEFSTVTASLGVPVEFPTLSDAVYEKQFKNLGGQVGRLYGFGVPVTDPDPEFLVPGQEVFLGVTSADGFTAGVPLHTCAGYGWFFDQNPTNVQSHELPTGTAFRGTVGSEVIVLIPVVLS